MLKKSGSYSGLLLDEYKDASLRVGKQTLFLDNVKHVGAVNTSKSKPFAFQVVVLARSPLLFACDNELLRNEWMAVFSRYTEESINSSSDHRKSPEGNLIAFSQVFDHPIPIPSHFKQLYISYKPQSMCKYEISHLNVLLSYLFILVYSYMFT